MKRSSGYNTEKVALPSKLLHAVKYEVLFYVVSAVVGISLLIFLSFARIAIAKYYGCNELSGDFWGSIRCEGKEGETYWNLEKTSADFELLIVMASIGLFLLAKHPMTIGVLFLIAFLFEQARVEYIERMKLLKRFSST